MIFEVATLKQCGLTAALSSGDKHIYQNKDSDLGCVSIDGATNSITYSLGTGKWGHKNLVAFAATDCAGDSRMGVITAQFDSSTQTTTDPNAGDCVNVNWYMVNEPSSANGHRINSVNFE
ncbi:MAG: hypothetical protein Q9191_002672 [Dirinaria sp. TL-2023a]